jgi:hypothetical protein
MAGDYLGKGVRGYTTDSTIVLCMAEFLVNGNCTMVAELKRG